MNLCHASEGKPPIPRDKFHSWVLLFWVWVTCLGSPASAGYLPMIPTLQPYQVISPGGVWRLDVKPSRRDGAGPALTTLTRVSNQEVIWKRMLPYTFWQSCVDDNGVVGGFAYTQGMKLFMGADHEPGEFVVAFMDIGGTTFHEERTRRTGGFMDLSYPYANRLHLDAENHRMLIVMHNGQIRIHGMRDGGLLSAFQPEREGAAFGYTWPDEIRFVSGTDLILLESHGAWGNSDETTSSSCVQLIDANGRMVWAASHRKVYGPEKKWPYPRYVILDPAVALPEEDEADPFHDKAPEDPFATEDPGANSDKAPELAGPPAPTAIATFAIYFGDTEEKAVFRVLDASVNHGLSDYRVAEVSREKHTLPAQEQKMDEDAELPTDVPKAVAKQLGKFALKKADGSPLTGISAVAIGPEEKIHAMEEGTGQVHVFDRNGTYLHLCDPGKQYVVETNQFSASLAVDDKGEVFVKISGKVEPADKPEDRLAGHYLRFSATGRLHEETLAPPSPECSGNLSTQPLSQHLIFRGFGKEVAIHRRDPHGSLVTTLTHRADGQWLDYIQDVAVAADGSLAVRDRTRGNEFGGFTTSVPVLPSQLPTENVSLYAADGTPLRTLDFTRYAALTRIAYDGKRIVATAEFDRSHPVLYVFAVDGTAVGSVEIAELTGKEHVSLLAFMVANGKEIAVVDQVSGMAFRYAMPE